MTFKSKRKKPKLITKIQQRKRELKFRFEQSKTDDNPEGSNRAEKKSHYSGKQVWQ